jgi:hypothetical protein
VQFAGTGWVGASTVTVTLWDADCPIGDNGYQCFAANLNGAYLSELSSVSTSVKVRPPGGELVPKYLQGCTHTGHAFLTAGGGTCGPFVGNVFAIPFCTF